MLLTLKDTKVEVHFVVAAQFVSRVDTDRAAKDPAVPIPD